jgi:hypothetical protein
MGADAFLAYYGVRWVTEDEDEISLLESRKDPRIVAARANKLEHWWGQTEQEGRYFLLIGACLGNLGGEGKPIVQISDDELTRIQVETTSKLIAANFGQEPALHLQYEPDY